MQVSIFQLHKKAAQIFDKIEDAFAISDITKSIAIADGATQGYFSGLWAKLIANEFITNPIFIKEDFYKNVLLKSFQKFNSQSLSIPLTANRAINILSKDKKVEGAYTTFLGIKISPQLCEIICCGDCNLFYLPNGQFSQVKSYPFDNLIDLNNENSFINTEHVRNNIFNEELLKSAQIRISVGDHLYLTTDAISRNILSRENGLKEIEMLKNFEQWLAFAENKWKDGSLENDDLTIVKIFIDGEQQLKIDSIIPPVGFSFDDNIQASETIEPSNIGYLSTYNNMNTQDKKELEIKIKSLQNELNELKKNNSELKQPPKTPIAYLLLPLLAIFLSCFSFILNYQSMRDLKHLKKNFAEDSTHITKKFDYNAKATNSKIESLNKKIDNSGNKFSTQKQNAVTVDSAKFKHKNTKLELEHQPANDKIRKTNDDLKKLSSHRK